MLDYPEEFLRGVLNDTFLLHNESGNVYVSSTFFKDKTGYSESMKKPGYMEMSINWYDEEDALKHLKEQLDNNGRKQYLSGVAVFSRIALDSLCRNPAFDGRVSYNRDELPNNKFHGNLLVKKEIIDGKDKNKVARDMISASIAAACFVRLCI